MRVRGILLPFDTKTPSGLLYPAEETTESLKKTDIDTLFVTHGGDNGLGTQANLKDVVGVAAALDLFDNRVELVADILEEIEAGAQIAALIRAGNVQKFGFNPIGTGAALPPSGNVEDEDAPLVVQHYSLRTVAITAGNAEPLREES